MLLVFVIAYYLSALLENGMDLEFMERAFGRDTGPHPIAKLLESDNPPVFAAGICHRDLFNGLHCSSKAVIFRFGSGIRDCKMGKY